MPSQNVKKQLTRDDPNTSWTKQLQRGEGEKTREKHKIEDPVDPVPRDLARVKLEID